MEDDFSQSLTPPVSPFASGSLCELTPARPPCFCCSETQQEASAALAPDGYAARGSLKRYSHCLPVCLSLSVTKHRDGECVSLKIVDRSVGNCIEFLSTVSSVVLVCRRRAEEKPQLMTFIWLSLLGRLLLRLDPAPADYETDTVEIFGFPWVTEMALVESTKPLFGLFR